MKKKNKKKLKLTLIIAFLIGIVSGVFLVRLFEPAIVALAFTGNPSINAAVSVISFILSLYVTFVLHIIIHEAGHLVFGLISGYKFNSFRIFNFMILKEEGRLVTKRLSIVGTGGQCLMSPPEPVNGRIPVVLYNLGGSLMNLILTLIALPFAILFPSVPFLSLFLFSFIFCGLITALINGIPISSDTINNDGHNALSLHRDPDALGSFAIQLKTNDMISRGVRLKDMPDEWFTLPTDEQMKNSMHATVAVFACNRLMDEGRFSEADELMERLLAMESGIIGVHRQLMICDRIFCEIVLRGDAEKVEAMRDKQYLAFAKTMKSFPSIIRTEYVYALLVKRSAEEAEKKKAEFDKMAVKYPYPSDIESERELLLLAEKIASERVNL
ncbi:MAG: M50 family metallopeptidase [Ruminococcaceae bacterium]|nr:M50 family metallopeptidase [Oscillospiraceae bacterium]